MRILVWLMAWLPLTVNAAPLTWHLQDVSFMDGGTAAGWFVFDAATGTVGDYYIYVSGGNTVNFPPFTYQNGAPNNTGAYYFSFAAPSPYFLFGTDIDTFFPGAFRQLRLAPQDPLTDLGGTVLLKLDHPAAAECFNCSPFRMFAGGSLVATVNGGPGGGSSGGPGGGSGGGPSEIPEPSTLWLCSAALVFLAAHRRLAPLPKA